MEDEAVVDQLGFAKVKVDTAAEICARFELKREARPLLGKGMAPKEFVEALLANKQYGAGIDFMAHALPVREAVWWGCLCVQHIYGSSMGSSEKKACTAAVQWVIEPTEEHRMAALTPAQEAGRASPSGQLAIAVNQTGGGPPGPFAPAKAVALAIKLSSNQADPAKIVDSQRLFVELGIGVAEGRFR